MNNRLSVRVCDDDGNLMYSQDYRVRKIIKQGVTRNSEELVYIDENLSEGISEGGYADGTHKLILVAEYNGCVENETVISVPYQYKIKESGQTIFQPSRYTLYSDILYKKEQYGSNPTIYCCGIKIQTPLAVESDQDCLTSVTGEVASINDFSCKITGYPPVLKCATANFFLSNQRLKGKRWLAVIPLENIYDTGFVSGQGWNDPFYRKPIYVAFRQNNVCSVKYTIVEVE